MKKELRKLDVEFISQFEEEPNIDWFGTKAVYHEYNVRYRSNCKIKFSDIELYQKVDVPESIDDFLRVNNISKIELVEWLNENYK